MDSKKLKYVIWSHSRQGSNSGPEFFIGNYQEIAVRSHHPLISIGPGPVLKYAPGHDSMSDLSPKVDDSNSKSWILKACVISATVGKGQFLDRLAICQPPPNVMFFFFD